MTNLDSSSSVPPPGYAPPVAPNRPTTPAAPAGAAGAPTPPAAIAALVLGVIGIASLLTAPIAWYLGISLWQAFVMDLAIAGFYVAYAFLFNLAYDHIFPVPATHRAPQALPARG